MRARKQSPRQFRDAAQSGEIDVERAKKPRQRTSNFTGSAVKAGLYYQGRLVKPK